MSPAVALSVLIVLIHSGQLVEASRRNFATVDEVGHIASGVSIWQTGSFAAYRVNPPLGRLPAALPVVAARPGPDYHRLRDEPGDRPGWDVGRDFIESNLSRYHDLVVLARAAGALWSIVGAWIVFRGASELHGPWAGCPGVAWWCSDPAILTPGHPVTPDIPATVAGPAASYAFSRVEAILAGDGRFGRGIVPIYDALK